MTQALTDIALVLTIFTSLIGVVAVTVLLSVRRQGSEFGGDDLGTEEDDGADVETGITTRLPTCWDPDPPPELRRRG
jgi:hypothetical protein